MAHVTWSKHRQVMISRVVINTKRFYRTDVMQGQSRVRSANVAGGGDGSVLGDIKG